MRDAGRDGDCQLLRVNVNVQMFDTMYNGLGVSEGDGMYLAPDKRVAIWGPQA